MTGLLLINNGGRMNNKPKTKLLTISLLCCGRADTTERCLKSLMPLREAIDSELQVVDTGCSPETRAVIEKYADEVFEFTWVNDFAAARNFQLDQANGKIFLFIDDDEFFLDCKYMIEFFQRPDCTDYNIGGYYQRNYLDFEGLEYEDIEVIRMCTVTPETYFVGKVHEYIEPSYGNAMFMDARAGHFGYVYVSKEDNVKHSMRNIPLLKEMMETYPDNLRWPYQLAQEYRAIEYYEELLDLCKKAYDTSLEIGDEESLRYRGPFAAGVMIALANLKRDDEVLAYYEEQMSKNEILPIPKAKLAAIAAKVMFVRGMNDECEKTSNFYFDVKEHDGSDRGQMFIQGGIFINDTFDDVHQNAMYCYLMTCGMRRNDFGPLVHYYRRISWDSAVVRINRGFVMTLIAKSAQYGYKKELRDVLNKFFVRPGFRDILEKEIDDNFEALDEERIKNLKAAFKTTDREKELVLYIDIREKERNLLDLDEEVSYRNILPAVLDYAETILTWNQVHCEWTEEKDDGAFQQKEVRVANVLKTFAEHADENPTKALGELKTIIGFRPVLDPTIQKLTRAYGEYQKVVIAQKSDPAKFQEMYNLEEAVLHQIAELDAAGKSEEALATYSQLVEIIRSTYGIDTLHI